MVTRQAMRDGERLGRAGGDKTPTRTLRNAPLSELRTGPARAWEVGDTGSSSGDRKRNGLQSGGCQRRGDSFGVVT